MEFLQQIINCSEEEADKLVAQKIEKLNNAKKQDIKLGFTGFDNTKVYPGFIPLNAKIQYEASSVITYNMNSIDFIYDFIHSIRKLKINNLKAILNYMVTFLNNYFGIPKNGDKRDEIFYDKKFQSTKTDEELFDAIEKNNISELKGLGIAMCTERSAVVQQILSLFDILSYYCIGCVDTGNIEEAHCFNIVRVNNNQFLLVDCSATVEAYKENGSFMCYLPFKATLPIEEVKEFAFDGVLREFENYRVVDGKKVELDSSRKYIVGKTDFKKEERSI